MLAPEEMASRMPQWLRALLIGMAVVLASGAVLFAYRYYSQPRTLTLAAGSTDGEAVRLMSAIAGRLTQTGSRIRLKVVDSGNALGAAKAFSEGKVDLAIVRADGDHLSDARAL